MKILNLKELVLDNNPLNDDGATDAFIALKSCSKLEKLSFENIIFCSSEKSSFHAAGTSSAYLPDSNKRIDGNSEVTSKWIASLAESMKHWSQLRIFNGSSNSLRSPDLAKQAVRFKSSKLEYLLLRENKIATEGLYALAESIKTCHLKS